jgi:uncharacterized protein YeaO (DUF488 family)
MKRAYEKPDSADGLRILVDRLRPRGLAKKCAKINHWLKDIAPSHGLRKWFGHDPEKWREFRRRYIEELKANNILIEWLITKSETTTLTLVYSAKNDKYNNAAVLKKYIESRVLDCSDDKK